MNPPPRGSRIFRFFDRLQHGCRQPVTPADHLKPRALPPELFGFETQESAKQPEDALHLGWWTSPVIGRKRIESQTSYTYVRSMVNHSARRGHSGTMAGDSG
jgi:hypothetical protein